MSEIFIVSDQPFEPKVSSKINEFGGFKIDELFDTSTKFLKKELLKITEHPKDLI